MAMDKGTSAGDDVGPGQHMEPIHEDHAAAIKSSAGRRAWYLSREVGPHHSSTINACSVVYLLGNIQDVGTSSDAAQFLLLLLRD